MIAWQVKSRMSFNGSTSDDFHSPVDVKSFMDMSRRPGAWRMVETRTVAPTPSHAKGIPLHRQFSCTGSVLDGIPVYHVVEF